jgi:phage gpG-like protein
MLRAELDAGKLIAGLDTMPAQVVAAVATKMKALTINLQRHVITDKLHGQVLKQRSGKLARSIQRETRTEGELVVGEIFSTGDVKYARIHEYGGTTKAHDIIPTKAQALRFAFAGAVGGPLGPNLVFAKVVHHPGSKIPERSFLRSSLADQASEIVAGLKQAAIRGAQQALGQ